ncbi:pentatricopeptide repeat-containing protein At1g11290, chloroplastic [Amaranthus tricolor]|uniref:pentatricopeptide repeat-containing protein At1g11290, chloroplastic n=1 Tax=Amaranthus tricolor TaxID=29722 RepID=UPI00258BE3CF|nr:pentatricopeptide repeat-containing protein At1g11290, chloroplastic [Amaranthus tricolor]
MHTLSLPPSPPTNPSSFSYPKPQLSQRVFIPSHIYKHPAAILLEFCTSIKELYQIIPLVYKHGLYDEHLFQTKFVSLFCKFNRMNDAARVFEPIEDKLDALYHTMLKGYYQNGSFDDAFYLFCRMKCDGIEPIVYNFTYLLKLCGDNSDIRRGSELHGQLIVNGFSNNLFGMNGVMNMYAKCNAVLNAYKMFDRMPEKDVASWNAIIAGYAQNGFAKIALELVVRMQEEGKKPDWITLITVLPALADMGVLVMGKSIHGYVLRAGFDCYVNVLTALIDMYAKCRAVGTARLIFNSMESKTVVTWNSMIDGYIQIGNPQEALKLFDRMLDEGIVPSDVSIMEAANACANMGDIEKGIIIHKMADQLGFSSNVSVTNCLISMYSKCKKVDDAVRLFNSLKNKTRVSWNALIIGFAQNGRVNDALNYFSEMQSRGIELDSFTLVSVIPALAELSILRQAKWIHGLAIRTCLDKHVYVKTALIDMYAKCGAIKTARRLFDDMEERHTTTWNIMIDAYGTHGLGEAALEIFFEMQKGSILPNEVTFLCLISACSHSGLVEDGKYFFDLMKEEYNLEPAMDHYGAMVDLLGRAGLLDEAWDFIENMPIEPGISVYGAMLGACKIHKNIELGELAANRLFDMDPDDGGYHVLLANLYSAASMWDKVLEVRSMMEKKGLRKTPGCSLVELRNEFHTFHSGSTMHPQSREIYAYLDSLIERIKRVGYVPDTSSIHDVEADVQEQLLSNHSEKLAIAFGLLNTSPGVPIHVRKNLRVCGDCHNATKYISLVTGREIIVRDFHRFHHFKNGSCSCGDYW